MMRPFFSVRAFLASALLLLPSVACLGQTVVQAGPWQQGNVPVYDNPGSSVPTVVDSGSRPASLFGPNVWQGQQTFIVNPVLSSCSGYVSGNAGMPITCSPTIPLANISGINTIVKAALPLAPNAAGGLLNYAAITGNVGKVVSFSGTLIPGDCLVLDANGNASASACTNGSGVVVSGTAGDLAYYPASTSSVSATPTGTGVLTALGNATNVAGGVVTSPVAAANLAAGAAVANLGSPTGWLYGNGSSNPTGSLTIPGSNVTFSPPDGSPAVNLQSRGQSIHYATDDGASGSTATATGSSVSAAAVTLGSAQDFKNGQGVLIPGAGPVGPATPTTCSGTFTGAAGGTSTIRYWISPLGVNGGYGGASSCDVTGVNIVQFNGTITTGPTNLLINSVAYGTPAVGELLVIPGSSNSSADTLLNANLGSNNWYLSNNEAAPLGPETMGTNLNAQQYVSLTVTPGVMSSFTASLSATNLITVTGSVTGSPISEGMTVNVPGGFPVRIIGYKTGTGGSGTYYIDNSQQTIGSQTFTAYMGYAVWKQCITNCNGIYTAEAFLGMGDQPTYVDNGLLSHDAGGNGPYTPSWLPATHPTVAGNDWCVGSILSGGGTTSLTLAAACPTPVSGVIVQHDDTAAINKCLADALPTWTQCTLTSGVFNTSAAIHNSANVLWGNGDNNTTIQVYGNQDAWAINQGGGGGGNFTLSGLATGNKQTSGLGKAIMSGRGANVELVNIYAQYFYDGIELFDTGMKWFNNLHVDHMRSETGACLHVDNDGGAGGGGAIGTWVYMTCGTIGGNGNYGTRQHGFWFDGAVGGGNFYSMTVGSIAGEGQRISNDIGAGGSGPFNMKFYSPDIEFPTGAGLHITTPGRGNRFSNASYEIAGWKNFVSCAQSAGVILEPVVDDAAFGTFVVYGNSGDGIYSNGTNISLQGVIYNNSARNPGGTNGVCSDVEFGSSSNGNAITGSSLGGTGDKSLYPVLIDSGATGNSAVGNAFNGAGETFNHGVNNGGATNIVACNGGSDVVDCNVPSPMQPGSSYVGPGDLGLNSVVTFAGARCYSKSYTGNVLDIWDAATGSTTETLLKCQPGGFFSETVNPLSTTCASGCLVKEAYDQVGTNHFIQATNALRPAFLRSGCGYVNTSVYYPYCLSFTGTQYLQAATVIAVPQPVDLMMVTERTGAFTSSGYILTTGPTASGGYVRFNNLANSTATNFGTGQNEPATDTLWHSILTEGDGATGAIQIDGALFSGLSLGTNGASTVWTIGATNAGAIPLTGNVASVMLTGAANGPNAAGSLFPLINANQHSYWGF